MSDIRGEMDKIKIPKGLHDRAKMGVRQAKLEKQGLLHPQTRNRTIKKRIGVAAAAFLIAASTLTFTPALAALQELYDKMFSSENIDDSGLKAVIDIGHGQSIAQTYQDETNGIRVNFQNILTDDKETKLLLSFQSETVNLEEYHLDIFEGYTSVYLIGSDGQRTKLNSVGWGSRYYDSEENKVVVALSFDSIKQMEGQKVKLEVENPTIYNDKGKGKEVAAVWPVEFTLDKAAVSDRESYELNKQFTFENETYTIKEVEFSAFETRVVVTGTDTGPYVDENGEKYDVMSKLENQLLHARIWKKNAGYSVDESKTGVFLKSGSEKVAPIFNKNEVPGPLGEYIMVFGPVTDRTNCVLEVADEIKIPLK